MAFDAGVERAISTMEFDSACWLNALARAGLKLDVRLMVSDGLMGEIPDTVVV
jgi:hypothetical protein